MSWGMISFGEITIDGDVSKEQIEDIIQIIKNNSNENVDDVEYDGFTFRFEMWGNNHTDFELAYNNIKNKLIEAKYDIEITGKEYSENDGGYHYNSGDEV